MRRVELDGRQVDIPVRVSRRTRRLHIVVDRHRNPEIVVPPSTSERAIDDLLVEHKQWLEQELRKPAWRPKLGLDRPDIVWADGIPWPRTLAGDCVATWYREQARARFVEAAEQTAAAIEVDFRRLEVRDQRTRWGSCSTRGVLSFNWRLVLAPPDVLQYVVAHEVCHLRIYDHTRRFWQLVEEARPTWRREKDWLNEHGPELLEYRVPE